MFFFSSRRRHTRSLRDWSSDVCSSDLPPGAPDDMDGRLDTASDMMETIERSGSEAEAMRKGIKLRRETPPPFATVEDRKSTRLNSSHVEISYAVFCLKKKINTSKQERK